MQKRSGLQPLRFSLGNENMPQGLKAGTFFCRLNVRADALTYRRPSIPLSFQTDSKSIRSLWVLLRLSRGLFQRGDIELFHRHHRAHCRWVTHKLIKLRWDNLPAEAKLILEPSAAEFRASGAKF